MPTHTFGPENGTLRVRTGRRGAAAKAGHDLLIEVTRWEAAVEAAEGGAPESVMLDVDSTSFRVLEGTGGMQSLDDDDRANIQQTIDDEVLQRQPITFRSTAVRADDDGRLSVDGELTLNGATRPLTVDAALDDGGGLNGRAVVRQSGWGMTPYSALFGALKVADEVRVEFDGRL